MPIRYSLVLLFFLILMLAGCKDDPASTRVLPPEFNLPDSYSALSEEDFFQSLNVTDPQGLDLQVVVEGLPGWLEFLPHEKSLQGFPLPDDTGLYELKVTANNGTHSVSEEFRVRVFFSEKEIHLQDRMESSLNSITPGLRGLSVAVVDEHGDLYRAYTGNMGSGASGPIYRETSMFRVASVTKPMTAALVLKLVEDGLVDLDDKLSEYYTTPLPNADSMTIRQILSHTAGIYDHLNSSRFWSRNYSGRVWTVEDIVQVAVQNGSLFNPGVSYGYSNTGFCVLGALVEEVTGLEISEAYEQVLFNPLGLEYILYDNFSNPDNPIPDLAYNNRSYEYHLTAAGAAGAIAASPSDVAMLGWNLYGGRIISPEISGKMNINYGSPVGGQNYGLGTRIWTFAGIQHHGHTGNLMDYRNILMYIPEADISIAMHSHDPHSNWFSLVDAALIYVSNNFSTTMAKRLPAHYYEPIIRE